MIEDDSAVTHQMDKGALKYQRVRTAEYEGQAKPRTTTRCSERKANVWESEQRGIGYKSCQYVMHCRYISAIRIDQLHVYNTKGLQFTFNMVWKYTLSHYQNTDSVNVWVNLMIKLPRQERHRINTTRHTLHGPRLHSSWTCWSFQTGGGGGGHLPTWLG